MAKKILTLNIGASSVALAEYEAGGKSLKLVNYGTAALAAPLDSGNAETILSPALLEIVREKGIRPGKVSVSLSGQMVFPRFAAIPMAGGEDKFDQMVRVEIEQNIPFPIDEMVCDRAILGDTETGDKAVMVVAAKIDQVESITTALAAAGFTPEIVDVAPLAVTNVLKAVRGDDGACVVILDIGAKTTSLVISEGEKLYNRSIPVAGNTITKEIAQLLGCTREEAEQIKRENAYVSMGGVTEDEDETLDKISKACRAVLTRLHAEISRSINFYRSQQGGGMPVKLYLTGGSSLLPRLDAFFSDSLQLEVEYLNPFEIISVGGGVDGSALESDTVFLAATAGVALHVAGLAGIEINLLPPSLVEARAEVARVPFVAVGAAGIVAALACWLVAAMGENGRLDESLDAATREADRLESITRSMGAAKDAEAAAWNSATNLAARLARRGDALERFETVRKAVGAHPGIWIAKWEVRTEKEQVKTPEQENSGRRGRRASQESAEIEVESTFVTIRCWDYMARKLTEGAAPEAAAPAEGDDAEAETAANPQPDAEGAEAADNADAAAAAHRARSRATVQNTVDMIVAAELKKSEIIVPGSVRTVGQKVYGKGGCLQEFVLRMQFKEPEYK